MNALRVVYIVMRDNGGSWEDYAEEVTGVFTSRRKAVGSLEADGYKLAVLPFNKDEIYEKRTPMRYYCAWIVKREVL